MKPFKVKVKNTKPNEITTVAIPAGQCFKIQAVYYSSTNPSQYLRLLDADKDMFMFKIPGQADPNPTTPEIETTIAGPLYFVDDGGGNTVIIWGELHQVEKTVVNL